MQAHIKYIRIAPKKLNLVASLVREMNAEEALNLLKFTPKKAAGLLYKALKSAVSNAENNFKQDKHNLEISEILVSQGPAYKRFLPVSRGRAHPLKKFTSHVRITLSATTKEKKNIGNEEKGKMEEAEKAGNQEKPVKKQKTQKE